MHAKISFFAIFLVLNISFISCTQEEGFGGNSHIKGVLMERVYNDDCSILLDEFPAKDENIYLLFGNDKGIGENCETSFTGDFNFSFLWPGKYTLYYYSTDTADINADKAEVVKQVSLDSKETLRLDTLYTYSIKKWNDGAASIKGKVYVKNYKNESEWPNLVLKDITPAQELEIYLTYGDHEFYDERIRTQSDGTFVFNNLIKGNYKIFFYSEDVKGGTANVVIERQVQITENEQVIDFGETIYIEKL